MKVGVRDSVCYYFLYFFSFFWARRVVGSGQVFIERVTFRLSGENSGQNLGLGHLSPSPVHNNWGGLGLGLNWPLGWLTSSRSFSYTLAYDY